MKGFLRSSTLGFALLAAASLGFGQTNTMPAPAAPVEGSPNPAYAAPPVRSGAPGVISPGTINYMERQVSLDNRPLNAAGSVVLQPGQLLTTANGFAEVLLTPGAFLRVGNDSQVRLITAGLADTKAQLDRGTAMIEVDQLIKGTNLQLVINGATVQLEKKGLYDFDAGEQAVRVLDGKAKVTEAARSKTIGKGDQVLFASTKPLKTSGFDMKALKTQPLYVWSEARSQDESRANVALAQNVAVYGGWYGPGWYWDPYWSFYAYLPGNGFFYSPFGWGFYSPAFIGYYGVPYRYYGHYGTWHGHVGGVNARINGFHGNGIHSVPAHGFHAGGGFHGAGGRR